MWPIFVPRTFGLPLKKASGKVFALNAFNVIFPLFQPSNCTMHIPPPPQDDDDNGVEDDAVDINYDAEGDDNDEQVLCLKSRWSNSKLSNLKRQQCLTG